MRFLLNLRKPSIFVKNINNINFEYLKNHLKISHIVFDKDDTLCSHHVNQLHQEIDPNKIKEIVELFGEDSYICSNDKRKWVFDFSSLNELVRSKNAFRQIETGSSKKPFNHLSILYEINKMTNKDYEVNNLCFVGDRILTDVFLAKKLNSFSILVDNFPESKRKVKNEILIRLENFLSKNHLQYSTVYQKRCNGKIIEKEKLFLD